MKKNTIHVSPVSEDSGINLTVGQINIDMKKFNAEPDCEDLVILPTRNLVLFPGVDLSIGLGRDSSIKVAEFSERTTRPIGIVCQKRPDTDNPKLSDLFNYGVFADVLKVLELPDGNKTAIVRARGKFKILGPGKAANLPEVLSAAVKPIHEPEPRQSDKTWMALCDNVKKLAANILRKTFEHQPPIPFDDYPPVTLINSVATNMPIKENVKFHMLSVCRLKQRAEELLAALQENDEMIDISQEIMSRARQGMEENHRSAFLQQQLETIREELYGTDADDADDLIKRAESVGFPEKVAASFKKEVEKLRRLNPQAPDYSVQYTYLDTLLSLPWSKETELNTDFKKAEEELDADHYGLEKVKERIIEQIAVMMNNPHGKAPIICLVGPPGVGKTSLGASIASALGRKYQRVALGGLHDESEIRGHRRTYIGAMPGRIIDAMKRAETRNPVLLLDEIDKIGADYKGDPSAALLEVLDPEQNWHFHDNYVDVDFDLSHVLFIATANTLDKVSRPLLDRIEVIEIPGYLLEEKVEIAKRHLIPRLLVEQGWEKDRLKISDEALAAVVENYTGESGVRQLEKQLAKILRRSILAHMRGEGFPDTIEKMHLKEYLGTAPYHKDKTEDEAIPGVVTGLAWTQAGGEILLVEVSLSQAKQGGKLTLTGNLGDVMKESASIAMEWVKANSQELGIDSERFETTNVHVHFPEGAIPKDGPSAGITMVTAITSAFTGRSARMHLAMTGEATLRGKVLPVGGIREKLLAAKRAGVTDIILSDENKREVGDIPEAYLKGMNLHHVKSLKEVLDFALN